MGIAMQIAASIGIILAFVILMIVSAVMHWQLWIIIVAVLALFVATTYGMTQVTIRSRLKKLEQEDEADEE